MQPDVPQKYGEIVHKAIKPPQKLESTPIPKPDAEVLAALVDRLKHWEIVRLGPCRLTSTGIAFRGRLLFFKSYFIPWYDVEIRMEEGKMYLSNKRNRKAEISISIRNTENAMMLPPLVEVMRKQVRIIV